MNRDRIQRLIVALILLLFILGPLFTGGVGLLVNWIWFGRLGYRELYLTTLDARIWMSTLAGFGLIAVVGTNLLIARSAAHRHSFHVYQGTPEFPFIDRLADAFNWVIWIGLLLVGFVVAEWGSTHWLSYLLARHAQRVGTSDPIFGIDIGFYLFVLSYHWFLYHLAMATLIISIIATAFLYLLEGGIWMTPRGVSLARAPRAHLLVLGGLVFALLAYRARLAMYGLLFSPHGIIFGARYADVHAKLPAFKLILILCGVTALMFFWSAVDGRIRRSVVSVLALAAVAFIGVNVWPGIVERLIVTPDQLAKEEPFIENNIRLTRQAYKLDHFEVREFAASEDLTLSDIRSNVATIHNVRLWDHRPLHDTFAQLQEMRAYYAFSGIDTDRYWINGKYRQVLLSARELSTSLLPDPTWVNRHLIYTHGEGVCLGPVNQFTSDGLPVLLVKDIPPVSTVPSLEITRPEIYFGEKSNNYCFVKARQQEFDYPSGSHDVYTTYQGSGGIPIENFWRRLLFTLYFGQKNILFSTDIASTSRIMIHRRILRRAERLTPFLQYDPDPYLVIRKNGSLYWILDGYTTSSWYPYSTPFTGIGNYIRNSVKATINAYNGNVRFYVSDPSDPLIRAYEKIYPGVFKPLSSMPKDLLAHIRYPEAFFTIQAAQYAVYHMTDPRVFYNKEDLWRVARSNARGPGSPMVPYYAIMKLADVGTTEEFILMVPFTPPNKNNMIAWMAARCDAPNYGKVVVFEFPKKKLVYGPQQIESQIDQNPRISEQLTLWGQGGSSVIRGTLLVIPVMKSILYIEPLYLAAQAGGAIPQLKRVIVVYAGHVVMDRTLDGALADIFGGAVPSQETVAQSAAAGKKGIPGMAHSSTLTSLIQQANQEFEEAQRLLRQGRWADYGAAVAKLKQTLRELAAASPKNPLQ